MPLVAGEASGCISRSLSQVCILVFFTNAPRSSRQRSLHWTTRQSQFCTEQPLQLEVHRLVPKPQRPAKVQQMQDSARCTVVTWLRSKSCHATSPEMDSAITPA